VLKHDAWFEYKEATINYNRSKPSHPANTTKSFKACTARPNTDSNTASDNGYYIDPKPMVTQKASTRLQAKNRTSTRMISPNGESEDQRDADKVSCGTARDANETPGEDTNKKSINRMDKPQKFCDQIKDLKTSTHQREQTPIPVLKVSTAVASIPSQWLHTKPVPVYKLIILQPG
jgi:hypothetical protein